MKEPPAFDHFYIFFPFSLKPKSLTDTLLNARQSQLRHNAEESGGEEQQQQQQQQLSASASPSKGKPFQEDKIEHNVLANNESD